MARIFTSLEDTGTNTGWISGSGAATLSAVGTTVPGGGLSHPVAGTWVIKQVTSTSGLNSAAGDINGFLDLDGVVGFGARIPWNSLETSNGVYNTSFLDACYNLAAAKGKKFRPRVIAGQYTPSYVKTGGGTWTTDSGSLTAPLPFTNASGAANTVFETAYANLMDYLVAWIATKPAGTVPAIDCTWYSLNFSELYFGSNTASGATEVQGLFGGNATTNEPHYIAAHKRLIDIAYARSSSTLSVAFGLSGHGPIGNIADELSTYMRTKTGSDYSPRLLMNANGWGPTGEWGGGLESTHDQNVWPKKVLRGVQDIHPANAMTTAGPRTTANWNTMFNNAETLSSGTSPTYPATWTEIYAEQIDLQYNADAAAVQTMKDRIKQFYQNRLSSWSKRSFTTSGTKQSFFFTTNVDYATTPTTILKNEIYGQARIYLTAVPSAVTQILGFPLVSSATAGPNIAISASQRLVARLGTTTLLTGPTTLALNRWYYLAFRIKVADTGGVIELRLCESNSQDSFSDAVTEVSFTGDTRDYVNDDRMEKVVYCSTAGFISYDDVVINDTSGTMNNSWPKNVKNEFLTPLSDGDTVQFLRDSGTSNAARVSEDAPNGDTSYVRSSTVGAYDLYKLRSSIFDNQSSDASFKRSVDSVTIFASTRELATNANVGFNWKYSGTRVTSADAFDLAMSTAYETKFWVLESDPVDGNVFTLEKFKSSTPPQLGPRVAAATTAELRVSSFGALLSLSDFVSAATSSTKTHSVAALLKVNRKIATHAVTASLYKESVTGNTKYYSSGTVAALNDVRLNTGFEHGSMKAGSYTARGEGTFSSVVGAVSSNSVNKKSASYSLKVDNTAGAAYAIISSPDSFFSSGTQYSGVNSSFRFWVKFANVSGTESRTFFSIGNHATRAANQVQLNLAINPSTGRYEMDGWVTDTANTDARTGTSQPSVSYSTTEFHLIELLILTADDDARSNISTPFFQAQLRINGSTVGSLALVRPPSFSSTTGSTETQIVFGSLGAGTTSFEAYFDDFIYYKKSWNTTDSENRAIWPIGAGITEVLKPESLGNTSNPSSFRNSNTGAIDSTIYTFLDEVPLDANSSLEQPVALNADRGAASRIFSTDTSLYTSNSQTWTNGAFFMVFVTNSVNSGTPGTPTLTSDSPATVAWTQVTTRTFNGGLSRVTLFRGRGNGTTGTISATFTASQTEAIIDVVSATNVDINTPIRNFTSANNSTTAITPSAALPVFVDSVNNATYMHVSEAGTQDVSSSTLTEIDDDIYQATQVTTSLAGTWVLQQASSVTELLNAESSVNTALTTFDVTGFCIRVPWNVIELSAGVYDLSILEEAKRIANNAGKQLSIRFMAGRWTPTFARGHSMTYDGSATNGNYNGAIIPLAFSNTGGFNTTFDTRWKALIDRLYTWARANGVRFVHAAWYGLAWSEIAYITQMTTQPGHSYNQVYNSHKGLLDYAIAQAGTDITTEFATSGHIDTFNGSNLRNQLKTYLVSHPNKNRTFWSTNNVDNALSGLPLGASDLRYGAQMVGTSNSYDWNSIYRIVKGGNTVDTQEYAEYLEVYTPSFTGGTSATLKTKVTEFAPAATGGNTVGIRVADFWKAGQDVTPDAVIGSTSPWALIALELNAAGALGTPSDFFEQTVAGTSSYIGVKMTPFDNSKEIYSATLHAGFGANYVSGSPDFKIKVVADTVEVGSLDVITGISNNTIRTGYTKIDVPNIPDTSTPPGGNYAAGLMGRNGNMANTSAFNPEILWSQVEPTEGSFNFTSIDSALATGKPIRLRIWAGRHAPTWLKNSLGTITINEPQSGDTATIVPYWQAGISTTYWQKFKNFLTAIKNYIGDNNPQIYGIQVSGTMWYYSEPFIHQFSDATTRQNAINAGFTNTLDKAAQYTQLDVYDEVFKAQNLMFAFNNYQGLSTSGTLQNDMTFTNQFIIDFRARFGNRAIIANHSIRESYIGYETNNGTVYPQLKATGHPLTFQTATWDRIDSLGASATQTQRHDALVAVLNWAISMGAHAVELPSGHNLTAQEMALYDAALKEQVPQTVQAVAVAETALEVRGGYAGSVTNVPRFHSYIIELDVPTTDVPGGGEEPPPPPPPDTDPDTGSKKKEKPDRFRRVNWSPFEAIRSQKLNRQTNNQIFLNRSKLDVTMQSVDPSSRQFNTPRNIYNYINMYAEYRDVTTRGTDETQFNKTITFPKNLFVDGIMPAVFLSVGVHGNKALKKVHPLVVGPKPNSFTARVKWVGGDGETFDDDMRYFINLLAVGPTKIDNSSPYGFTEVDWGTEKEQVEITSEALNQMITNTELLYKTKVAASIRNMDVKGREPDPDILYLNNGIAIYAKYEEFTPEISGNDKETSDPDDTPKSFMKEFKFPKYLFNSVTQPVVVYNIGVKVTAEPATDVRKLTSVLKSVRGKSFTVEITEHSLNAEFAETDTYFISYMVIGDTT